MLVYDAIFLIPCVYREKKSCNILSSLQFDYEIHLKRSKSHTFFAIQHCLVLDEQNSIYSHETAFQFLTDSSRMCCSNISLGALKYSAPLPWQRNLDFCILNEQLSSQDEGFIYK